MYFIDSNIFVYAKIGDRKYGDCSKKVIKEIYEGKINAIIDNVVLLEVANALKKLKIDPEEEILAILSLPIDVIEVKKEDILDAIKNEKQLSPYDALHYTISKRYSAKIITADKDFKDRIDPCDFSS